MISGTGAAYYGIEMRFFSPGGADVSSMGGLRASGCADLTTLPDWQPDTVAVIGGTIWESDAAPDLTDLLQAQHQGGGVVAGICGATLALARAGLLEGVDHTSNAVDYLPRHVPDYRGQPHYLDQPMAARDQRIVTASGLAPASFAAEVFAALALPAPQIADFRQMLAAEHVRIGAATAVPG